MSTPLITGDAWGRIDVGDQIFKDAKLWPGGAREWDWNETGTRHEPGVGPADVIELLDADPDVVIIGNGRDERLGVTGEALAAIADHGARAEVLETGAAIARCNDLIDEGVAVAALLHSTC